MRSDALFTVPLIASAKTHAELSDQPVYLLRWSIDDELNYFKKALKATDQDKGEISSDSIYFIKAILKFS